MSVKSSPLGRMKVAAVCNWKGGGFCQVQRGRGEHVVWLCLMQILSNYTESKTRHFISPAHLFKGTVSNMCPDLGQMSEKQFKTIKRDSFTITVELSCLPTSVALPLAPAAATNCTDPDTIDIMSYESLALSPTSPAACPCTCTSPHTSQ